MRSEAMTDVAADHDTFPRKRDDLVILHRTRDYVEDAILCFACERPMPIVDRNVVQT